MLPAGMILMWAGYSVSLWGWCLLRGYDVTLGQLMSPLHPYGSGKGQPWPPKLIGSDVIWPGGRTAAGASSSSGGASSSSVVPGTHLSTGSTQQGLGGDLPSTGIDPGRR